MAKKTEQLVVAESPPPPPPRSITELVIDVGRQWAILAGAVIGFGYLSGYIIVNFYLSRWGVRPPNLVASRYLATGILYILSISIPLALILIGFRPVSRKDKEYEEADPSQAQPSVIRKFFVGIAQLIVTYGLLLIERVFVGLVLPIVVSVAIAAFVSQVPNNKGRDWLTQDFWLAAIGITVSALAWLFVVAVLPSTSRKSDGNSGEDERSSLSISTSQYAVALVQSVFVIIVSFGAFAGLVYPFSNPALGGGRPVSIQLLLESDSLISDNVPMSDKRGLTESVDLIDQSDDGYIIKLSDKTIVIVPNDQIRGVLIAP